MSSEFLPEIVCEIGINGQGDIEIVKSIIDMCIDAAGSYPGKWYVKFQKRDVMTSTPKHMWEKRRISPLTGEELSYLDYRFEMEYTLDEYKDIDRFCQTRGIEWFVSVWDIPSVWFIKNNFMYLPYIKIPSAHLTNSELIKRSLETEIPIIISTGMSTEIEIDTAVNLVPREYPLTLLATTSSYPCDDSEINLNKIDSLGSKYPYARIGFSNHSPSMFPAIYSSLLDADMIEIHVTPSRALRGSDHAASIEKPGIERIFRECARIPTLLGDGRLEPYESEMKKRLELRG